MSKSKVAFVFGDIETTGLDSRLDVILEGAFIVTDVELNVLDSKSWIVLSPGWEQKLEAASDFVKDMHRESGLTADLFWANKTGSSQYGITSVTNDMFTWLFNHGIQGNYPLAGSTVGFDRKFLKEHMPQVDACFSHRIIDVSSIKELCKKWNPNVYAEHEKLFGNRKKAHRGRLDAIDSIEELEFYSNEFMLCDFSRINENQTELPINVD